MKVVAILQARRGSTRLPGKVMLPLAGKPMLQNIIERVQRAKRIDAIVVTCPAGDVMEIGNTVPDGILIDPWMGDENDLVARHLSAAKAMRADIVARIPSDNPCVDPSYIDQAVQAYERYPYMFFSNTTDTVNGVALDGIGAEVLSMSRLKWLNEKTKGNPLWREHPHQYFYDTGWATATASDMRLDVNTQDDYDFICSIYNHFGHNRFTAREILACPPVQERLHGR